jgi:hypothetical protein
MNGCHSWAREYLENHLEVRRCYSNFEQPHRAPRFGQEMRTPAMQAGLVSKQLSFSEIFTAVEDLRNFIVFVVFVVLNRICQGSRYRLTS